MTTTAITHIRTRTRIRPQPESTPESQRVAELEAMLADPRYAGYRDELERARAEMVALTATSTLAA